MLPRPITQQQCNAIKIGTGQKHSMCQMSKCKRKPSASFWLVQIHASISKLSAKQSKLMLARNTCQMSKHRRKPSASFWLLQNHAKTSCLNFQIVGRAKLLKPEDQKNFQRCTGVEKAMLTYQSKHTVKGSEAKVDSTHQVTWLDVFGPSRKISQTCQ